MIIEFDFSSFVYYIQNESKRLQKKLADSKHNSKTLMLADVSTIQVISFDIVSHFSFFNLLIFLNKCDKEMYDC